MFTKRFGYSGTGIVTESGFLITNNSKTSTIFLTASSEIVDVIYDNETEEFILTYKGSQHVEQLDKYLFYYVPENDLSKEMYDKLVGYTFYGKFDVQNGNESRFVFGKMVDMVSLL